MLSRWSSYHDTDAKVVATGWALDTFTGPSALAGSNGMTIGPDGRLYVTQGFGSQITAIDPDTGRHELFAPLGGGLMGPDDAFFAADGAGFVTEPMIGRVSAVGSDGIHKVVLDDLPAVNGITMDQQGRRLFVDEFRPGGRLLELDPHGEGEPRVLMEDLAGPNALAMGPDGRLYFPQLFAGQIWSYDLDGGRGELVVDGLDVPSAVKFDSRGRIVTSEAGAGRITAIDRRTGERETLAQVSPGIDNVSVGAGDRIFVSHYVNGRVAEETPGRQRVLADPGLLGPHGLWLDVDGRLLVADGLSVAAVSPGGAVERLLVGLIDLFTLAVGVCQLDGDLVVLGVDGTVVRLPAGGTPSEVLATGLAEPSALVADGPGGLLITERGGGRLIRLTADGGMTVMAEGLRAPGAAARDGDRTIWVSQGGGGRIMVLDESGGRRELGDFGDAQGLALAGDSVVVADVERRQLVAIDRARGRGEVVVVDAPIGPPAAGIVPLAFCPLCSDGDGGVYVGANGDGSIRRLRPR